MAACTPENTRAVGYLKTCPVLVKVYSDIGAYDFTRHVYPVSSSGQQAQMTASGRVLFDRSLLASWPGVVKDDGRLGGVTADTLCHTKASVQDAVKVLTGISLDLAMSEDQAKQARDTMKTVAEDNGDKGHGLLNVAVLLDGASDQEDLACSLTTPKAATGRVLAWRLYVGGNTQPTPVADWKSATNWEPPPSCDEAKAFFSPAPTQWDRDLDAVKAKFKQGEKVNGASSLAVWITDHNPACLCGTSSVRGALYDFEEWVSLKIDLATPDTDDAEDRRTAKLAELKGLVERGVKKFGASLFDDFTTRPGCREDNGAKVRMGLVIAQAKQALAALDDAVHKDRPNLTTVKARSTTLVALASKIEKEMDPSGNGAVYGCPR
jgi:hypothetical protein